MLTDHLPIDIREEIQELYLHRFLFMLAITAVAIFIPLYVYELTHAVLPVFFFFAVFYTALAIVQIPFAVVASHVGYKHTSLLSSPLLLAFYYILRGLQTDGMLLYLVAAIGGAGFGIYWIGMNSELARSSHTGNRGKETSLFLSAPMFATILSPFIGGIIITAAGFDALFLAVILVSLLSYVPFLWSKEHFSGMDASLRDILTREHATEFFTFFFRGVNSIGRKVLWPLYLGIIITGALNIGGAGSLMALGSALLTLIVGRIMNHENRVSILTTGGFLFAATWLVMGFVTTPFQAFVIAFLNGLLLNTVNLPVYSGILGVAEKADILEYFAFREIALCTGRVLACLFLALIFATFSLQKSFLVGFLVVAAAVLGMVNFGRHITFEE